MASHRNDDFDLRNDDFDLGGLREALEPLGKPDLAGLERKMKEMTERGENTITVGAPGEEVLRRWEHRGVSCAELPADELNVLRLSIGGFKDEEGRPAAYCHFRGSRPACIETLRMALRAMLNATGTRS